MTDKPLIGFIVPVYQTEEYLEKSLKSLLDQDYPNIEIICVMDGKSKKAEKIISKINSKRRMIPTTIEHSGAPKARNVGFINTYGDYLCFWDSDCYADPGMVTKWMAAFERNPDVDFVYEGYRINRSDGAAVRSHPFDWHLLTVENYISTCFPMKREVFPGFDESIQSLQDWDLWLTIVEAGGKGLYLGGYSFLTEPPRPESITGIGCAPEMWLERADAIKKKHGLSDRPVCFTTVYYEETAIELAKCAEADYLNSPGFHPNRYKLVVMVGFHPLQSEVAPFEHIQRLTIGLNDDCKKVIYWIGKSVWETCYLPFNALELYQTALGANITENWCESISEQAKLKKLGIEARIVPMPYMLDFSMKPLPDKPKVLLNAGGDYEVLGDSLIRAMPDIQIESPDNARIVDYNGMVRLTKIDAPDPNCSRMLLQGRFVVSNIKQPYHGYIDLNGDPDATKRKLIQAIRKMVSRKRLNHKAAKYYREMLAPEKFQKEVAKLCPS